MKKNYPFHFLAISILVISFMGITPANGQATPIILPANSFIGDILHSDAGSDFIGVLYTKNGNIYYNRIGYDGTWETEDSLGISVIGKMAIDNSDFVHVAFVESGKIAYRKFNGTVWSDVVYIVSNNGGACSRPDIAVDAGGNVHISYSDRLGDTGGQSDKDDIMYATNKTGSFEKTMIFRGYYENWGGSAYYGEYVDKGSSIAVNTTGDYFIAAHYQLFDRSSGGTAVRTYMIKVHSNLGTGNTSASSTDIFDLYDLVPGEKVSALYKQTGLKTANLTLSGSAISFSEIQDITASSVNAAAYDGNLLAVAGKTNTNLFTIMNGLPHVYTNLAIKGTVVPIAALDGLFYTVFTDIADNKIKIQIVADSLSFTAFSMPSQTAPAIINPADHTIHIEVAAGTNLSDLVATFLTTSDAASVEIEGTGQVSGITHNDFTVPLAYNLVSGDTREQSWQVFVSLEPATYTIGLSSSPGVGGTASGGGDYLEGSVVTMVADANEGYAFVNWTEEGSEVSVESEYSFTVASDRNLIANFVEQYTLTIQITGTGSVDVNETAYSGVITVNSGTTVNLEALAGDEYHFTGWTGDLVSVNEMESVIMDGDKVITAGFAINEYTLTIHYAGTGSVKVDGNTYSDVINVNSGTALDLEAVAGDGFIFTGWSGDHTSVTNPITLTITDDYTITASFEISTGMNSISNREVDVYPNPFSETIYINTSGTLDRVIITSLSGQMVKTMEMNGQNQMDAGDLEKGTYLMELRFTSGIRIIKKIIRE